MEKRMATQTSTLAGNPTDRRAWQATVPEVESDTTEQLTLSHLFMDVCIYHVFTFYTLFNQMAAYLHALFHILYVFV